MGVDQKNIFELMEGDSLILKNGEVTRGAKVAVSNVFVDGSIVGDVGQKVIEDRNALANDGIVVVVVPVDKTKNLGKVDIITGGFVYVKESQTLLHDSTDVIQNTFNQNKGDLGNRGLLKGKIEQALAKYLFKKTGREPLVLVSIVEV